jgi:fucose permease
LNIQVTSSNTNLASDDKQPLVPAGRILPFVLVTALFFLWAIPNNLNDILIRQFMKAFALTRREAGWVQIPFYCGYFGLAIPAGILMRRFGYKVGILVGLCLLACGSFLFWPAANIGSYAFFLLAQFVIASGLSFLETSANPIIVRMGSPSNAEERLNFSQAFNSVGSITAALAGTRFILSGVELTASQVAAQQAAGTYSAYLHTETLRVITPYLVLGGAALLLAFFIARTHFPSLDVEEKHEDQEQTSDAANIPALDIPNEVDWETLEQRKRLTGKIVSFGLFFGDRKQTDTRASYLEHRSGEHLAHRSKLLQIVCFAVDLRAHIEQYAGRAGNRRHASRQSHDGLGMLLQRHFILGVFAQFLYVGAQVGTWSYFIQYVISYAGTPERVAGYMLTGTLAAFAIGRFLSAWLLKFIAPDRLLFGFATCNVLLMGIAISQPNWTGVICLLVSSFFMSMMFPTIFALGIHGLGSRTKTGGSLMVMAIVGGAALTFLMGLIKELNLSYLVPCLSFAGIALYGRFWARPAQAKTS